MGTMLQRPCCMPYLVKSYLSHSIPRKTALQGFGSIPAVLVQCNWQGYIFLISSQVGLGQTGLLSAYFAGETGTITPTFHWMIKALAFALSCLASHLIPSTWRRLYSPSSISVLSRAC